MEINVPSSKSLCFKNILKNKNKNNQTTHLKITMDREPLNERICLGKKKENGYNFMFLIEKKNKKNKK